MRSIQGIGFVLLALGAGYIGSSLRADYAPTVINKEDAYARVMRSQTLRCGYGAWPPFINKDPVSGKLSGIFYDYTEALGHALSMKILWEEELGTGEFVPALKSGRIDAMCASIWPNAARAREIDFVRPIYYSPLYVYGRVDDHRFDQDLGRVNSPDVTIVSMDGEIGGMVAASDFPKAKRLDLPQGASVAEFFVAIAMKKADLTIASPVMFDTYDKNNPGKVRRILTDEPIRVFPNTIAVDNGQDRLRQMLDTATDEILSNGTVRKILEKYGLSGRDILRVSLPFDDRTTVPHAFP